MGIRQYPEINKLQKLFDQHQIVISFSATDYLDQNKEYPAVDFTLDGTTLRFHVNDELNDRSFDSPLLHLCLILRTLEDYEEVNDYIDWCEMHYFEVNKPEVLNHFKNLTIVFTKVKEILLEINSQISNWDFEMGSGALSELRK